MHRLTRVDYEDYAINRNEHNASGSVYICVYTYIYIILYICMYQRYQRLYYLNRSSKGNDFCMQVYIISLYNIERINYSIGHYPNEVIFVDPSVC